MKPLTPLSPSAFLSADIHDPALAETGDDFESVSAEAGPRGLDRRPPDQLTPAQREIMGQRFRAETLHHLYEHCESTAARDRNDALRRLAGRKGDSPPKLEALLDRMVGVLRDARLTINFKADQLGSPKRLLEDREIVNCFALGDKPGAPAGYAVGRAQMEEATLDLRALLGASAFADYGRFADDSDALRRQRWFQWTSRPVYGALDFLNGKHGGAAHYGESFLVLADHMKHVATFSPVDTFTPRFPRGTVQPSEVCTSFHFPRLIAHAQNDRIGYNCLNALRDAAEGKAVTPHANYGHGGCGNYIEAQIHGRIVLDRDVKEVHISRAELDRLSFGKQRDDLLKAMAAKNAELGRRFFIVH